MSLSRRLSASAVALCLLAACAGGSDEGSSGQGSGAGDDLIAEVASFDLAVGGPSRFLVGLLTGEQNFVVFGSVQLRFAYLGTKQENQPGEYGPPVAGRFLAVPGAQVPNPAPSDPAVSTDPETRGVYAALATFPRAGFYQVEASARIDGKTKTATAALAVNERHAVPGVGDQAPRTENLTVNTTDAPRGAIDSRAATGGEIPDPHLHQTTVAAALAAGRPVLLVISTPVYCRSRFCGPITEMVEDLGRRYADRATFIHIEVFRDGQNQVVNRSAAEWILSNGAQANEPWVFVIGGDGRIAARFDNVATIEELEPTLRQMPVIGPA